MSALPPEADIRQRFEHICFVPVTDIRHEARNPTRLTRIRLAADAGDVVAQG